MGEFISSNGRGLVLNETADSKYTVLKTLNIPHKTFHIGIKLQYQVVVGTGTLMTI
jgi:hypothetical protein